MEAGQQYLFLTLTYYWTGRIVQLSPTEVVIDQAAQVFDIGELEQALAKGEVALCQVLPGEVRVTLRRENTTAIQWKGALPKKSKRS